MTGYVDHISDDFHKIPRLREFMREVQDAWENTPRGERKDLLERALGSLSYDQERAREISEAEIQEYREVFSLPKPA